MSLIEQAKAFAIDAHGIQKYAGDKPYSYHLGQVVGVLQRFGVDDEILLAAAWLHDTVEDTDTTAIEIDRSFGMLVGDLVWAVTNEPGKNRKERHQKTYVKITTIGPQAVLLKLADRIANLEQCAAEQRLTGQSKLLDMYRKEHEGFVQAIKTKSSPSDTETRMWHWLEQLVNPVAI